jgi:hypothetical protein
MKAPKQPKNPPAYKRGPYKMRQSTIDQLFAFKPAFTQMVQNARANFGVLDEEAASQLLPDIEGISSLDLLEKIRRHHGVPCVNMFKTYFGMAKRKFDKQRIRRLQQNLNKGLITSEDFTEKKARCFTWCWTLLPEFIEAPGDKRC